MKETKIEGIITTEPKFISTFEDGEITKGMFDYDIILYSQKHQQLNKMSVRTVFDIEKWRPLHKYQRVTLSVLKTKEGKYKKLVSSYDNQERYSCNVVIRTDYE